MRHVHTQLFSYSVINFAYVADFPPFSSVQVSGCEGEVKRCPFVKGTNVSMNATFTSILMNFYQKAVESKNVTVSVWGKLRILRIKTPFPISPSSGCLYGIDCPVTTNSTNTFRIQMPIRSIYPSVDVEVGIELYGDNDSHIACVTFPATIVSN
ncbi:epididymal secretory protein E1-like protein [Leptotrombidium deliense]|uniref:Epididymal secretory protein E1-like protein n=1 Tax=Leptotrombidium deliense TaxID=299467 RepID=A0A443SKA9_9ACAR|nr:epididymal secretory protein E1-like protein [Leptotrombidium deliense]